MMTDDHRTLDPAEAFYVAQKSRAVLSCRFTGDIDATALATAFADCVDEQMPLISRIATRDDGRFDLTPLPDDERPRLTVRTAGPGASSREWNTPLLTGGPLVRAALLLGDVEHELVLSVDHVVCDGHSSINLYNAIWRRYSEVVAGERDDSPVVAQPWPAPVMDRLPSRPADTVERYRLARLDRTSGSRVGALPYGASVSLPPVSPGASEDPVVHLERILLDRETTDRLSEFVRVQGVSMHGYLAALVLLAVRRGLGPDHRGEMGCLSPVDLRSRLDPPVSRAPMYLAVTTFLDRLEVDEDDDPIELAHRISDNLHGFIDRGEFIEEASIAVEAVAHPQLLGTSAIVTNLGRVDGPQMPAGIDFLDLRLMPFRERYYPQAGQGPVMACVVTFDGRLGIEMPYSTSCFLPEQVAAIRNQVFDALTTSADAGALTR